MRLLLVEDSPRLSEAVSTGLRKSGYAVDVANDGNTGLWHAQSYDYDAIVLDLMLPGLDGLALLDRLRSSGKQTHVLILTARDTVEERVKGLRAGADDYLVKPFAFDELVARVEALIRRKHIVKSTTLRVRDLVVDTAARTVSRDGVTLDLPSRQYALFEYLLLRRGNVVTRSEIETHLYDALAEPMSNVVDATVYALRKRIDVPGQPSLIQTRRGMGYIMVADEEHA